ncbi:MAG: chemotaxis protein CheC [Verrucomicrobiota bacterium]|nr:chemotaxis protein CheC [Verrucomicrobiota bacterium]
MQLTDIQKDALTEVINIGFSRAAASLSDLTGHRAVLDVPEVSIHPIYELGSLLARIAPSRLVSVHQLFKGRVSGDAMLLLNLEGASALSCLLSDQNRPRQTLLDESAKEVLAEVGNILLNSCLATFADVLKVRISFALPRVELDVLEVMLNTLSLDAEELHYALVITTKFRLCDNTIEGCLVIVLGVTSLDHLLEAVTQLCNSPLEPKE